MIFISSTTCGMRWEVGGMYHFQGMLFRLMPLFAAKNMQPSEDVCWTWLDHPTVSGFRDMILPFEGLFGHGSHLRVKFKAVDEAWQPGGILEALRLQGEWWVCCGPPNVCTFDSFGEKIQFVLVPTYNGIHMPSHFFAGWQLVVDLRMKAHLSKNWITMTIMCSFFSWAVFMSKFLVVSCLKVPLLAFTLAVWNPHRGAQRWSWSWRWEHRLWPNVMI